jgi:hypothetical protein
MRKTKTSTQFVNSNTYAASAEGEVFSSDSLYSQIPDSIRYFSSNFWTSRLGKLVKSDNSPLFTVEETNKQGVFSLKADKSKFVNKNNFVNGVLTKIFDQRAWKSFCEDQLKALTGQTFYDHYTNLETPVVVPELDGQFTDSVAYLNREFVYNFHARRFENLASDISFSPSILPTVYDVTRDINLDTRTEDENLSIRFGGIIQAASADSLVLSKEVTPALLQYFDEYVKAYNSQDATAVVLRLKGKNTTNIITSQDVSRTAKYKKDFVPFPYYMQAEFSNKNGFPGSITELMNVGSGLQTSLLDFINSRSLPSTVPFIKYTDTVSEESVKVHNLKSWISAELADDVSPDNQNKITGLLNAIKKNLQVYTRKVNKLAEQDSKVSSVWYKIEKRLFNHTSKPLQTYFIDASGPSLINFIDTQIKYGAEYFYTVSCICIITGTKYSYLAYYETENTEKLDDIADGTYKIKINSSVDYAVAEMPYAKFSGAVHEKPNVSPQVQFDVVNDQLSLTLKQPALEEYAEYRAIENGEVALYESIRLSQENGDINKVRYALKSPTLQIYRLTDKPNSYIQFQNKLYKQLSLKEYEHTLQDELFTNKKYYYLFRYVNEHGVPSKPSEIYEIMLKDEEGYRYIQSSIVDLEPELVRKTAKDFKRYMLIKASQLQLVPNSDNNASDIDEVSFGPADGQVWGRQFLLKIRSKKTNRELAYRFSLNLDKKK